MNIKEMRKKANMTQTQFGNYLKIPMRTIQNWETKKSNCPAYIERLIEFKLEKENKI